EPIEGRVKREIAIVSSLGEHVVDNYVLVRVADFFLHAEVGIRGFHVTGVQTCALPISRTTPRRARGARLGVVRAPRTPLPARLEIGRASCRERGSSSAGRAAPSRAAARAARSRPPARSPSR